MDLVTQVTETLYSMKLFWEVPKKGAIMNPRKQNGHRGYLDRELKRKKARKLAASQWQSEVSFTPKEGKKMNRNLLTVLVIVLLLSVCCLAFVVVGGAYALWPRPAVVSTQAPALVAEPPVSLLPTAVVPVNPTEAPVVVAEPTAIPMPVPVTCDTPFILASLDGQSFSEEGEYLDTVLGERMTFTNRKIVVPAKAWNDPLSDIELKAVETTWVSVQVCVPEGMTGTVFSGGFEQKLNRNENGVLMSLKAGLYEFKIRNGEIVLWYPGNGDFAAKDLTRIVEQIKVGNFDIKSPLDFFGVTTDILPQIPAELVKERNVQIVSAPDPVVK